ncbi:MAG: hypothetical protein AAGH74_01925 [Pseudomonadota bacterium]
MSKETNPETSDAHPIEAASKPSDETVGAEQPTDLEDQVEAVAEVDASQVETAEDTLEKPENQLETVEDVLDSSGEPDAPDSETEPADEAPNDQPEPETAQIETDALEGAPEEDTSAEADTVSETTTGDPEPAEAQTDPEPHREPEPAREPVEFVEDDPEQPQSSFASTALMLLIGAIFISGLTLWGAPQIAPYLPASLAKFLAPASQTAQAEINALRDRIEELDTLRARVAVLEAVDMKQIAARISAAEQQAVANETALRDLALLVASLDSTTQEAVEVTAQLATDLGALTTDLSNLRTALSEVDSAVADATGALPVTEELNSAIASLETRLTAVDESLKVLPTLAPAAELDQFVSTAELAAIQAEIETQLAAIDQKATAAQESGSRALTEAQSSLRGTAIRSLSTELRALIVQGAPYAEILGELEAVSGVSAPEALLATANDGVVQMSELRKSFTAAARAALAADAQPVQGDGAVARISSWLTSQVSVRPTQPIQGASTGAILSRVEAAINADDGAGALSEASGLSEAAAGAMAGWLAQLSSKVNAEDALTPYIAAVGGES